MPAQQLRSAPATTPTAWTSARPTTTDFGSNQEQKLALARAVSTFTGGYQNASLASDEAPAWSGGYANATLNPDGSSRYGRGTGEWVGGYANAHLNPDGTRRYGREPGAWVTSHARGSAEGFVGGYANATLTAEGRAPIGGHRPALLFPSDKKPGVQ
jgi:hypothetical protein